MIVSLRFYCISCCVSGAVLRVSGVFEATLAAQGCRQCHPTLLMMSQSRQPNCVLALEFGSSFWVCGVPQ